MPLEKLLRIRQLPDSPWQPGTSLQSVQGKLHFTLEDSSNSGTFAIGSLVEVEEEALIHLGRVEDRQGTVVVLTVEHSLQRRLLAGIQDLWASDDAP